MTQGGSASMTQGGIDAPGWCHLISDPWYYPELFEKTPEANIMTYLKEIGLYSRF